MIKFYSLCQTSAFPWVKQMGTFLAVNIRTPSTYNSANIYNIWLNCHNQRQEEGIRLCKLSFRFLTQHFFSFGHKGAPFIRNNFSWATKLRQKISISSNAETYCIYIHFLFTIYCNLLQSFVTTRPFRLRNNLVNRAVEFFLNRSPEATPRIVFYCKQKKRRNLEFTKDLIINTIDTISYKAHFLLLKL